MESFLRVILLIHNYYQQTGGEDIVYEAECNLLKSYGHKIIRYNVHNKNVNLNRKLDLSLKTVWNQERYRELRKLLQKIKPNLVHVHNTLPLISPSVYHAVNSEKIPICQTLHNYRLLCPNALFFRNDMLCEDCIRYFIAWPGIRHACYRKSRITTMVVSLMTSFHRLMGTWKEKINVYIAPTEFSRRKYIQAGFQKNIIAVKPNFVENGSHIFGSEIIKKREGALFVGRLSKEKGVETLLKAWKIIGNRLTLKIVGEGPMANVFQRTVSRKNGIFWLGKRPIQEVYELMARSKLLVFTSECYESMPRTIIEAFSMGTPVISSSLGAMAEMIDNGSTGLHFEPGNAQDLAATVLWANQHPVEIARMGRNAREEYEAKYTPEKNYKMLMNIYEQAAKIHARQQL